MARSRPWLMTVALSGAAVAGYLAYRGLAPSPSAPVVEPEPVVSIDQIAPDSEESGGAAAPAALGTLPDFSLGNLAGEPQSIQSWPGKPLLINFWATWCAPCLREIPMLKELQIDRPDVQVVGVAVDKRDAVVKFAGDLQFNYPILIGQSEAWAAAGAMGVNIYALPFTIFVAGDGNLLGVHTGELHAEHLEAFRSVVDDLAADRIDLDEARGLIAERI
jgi:thiol-disulfide isomerase/thioredoxin